MCGIFCVFSNKSTVDASKNLLKTYETCKTQLNRRGPDFQSTIPFTLSSCNLLFASSVLWLQGEHPIKQPIENENSIFLYNGNLYGNNLKPQSDTELLLDALENSSDMPVTLNEFQGPYAFIYLDKRNSKLYYCRDFYGRRSLLIGTKDDVLLLTSVACKAIMFDCIELPAIGVFCYDLNSKSIEVFPWKFKHKNFQVKLQELENLLRTNIVVREEQTQFISFKCFVPPTEEDLLSCEELKNVNYEDVFQHLLKIPSWKNNVNILLEYLSLAVRKRVATQPDFCGNCIPDRKFCSHATTGILFSGGVDCTILALLADMCIEQHRPIDLLNVAFNHNAPDRTTGLESFQELKQLRPNRIWNFIEINVTEQELNTERSNHISDLIYPRCSILDDSLGCALWFASRGKGAKCESSCRVLLVGMGADELFGGYTKHRAALKHGSWSALHEALEEDWQNLSHRNLARDDRVVSDHARHLCTPYLDETVVEFVTGLNCWEKTYPTEWLPQGIGEKVLLRCLAHDIGLKKASSFKKRALQFGSRIANRKENANDVSPRL